MPRVPRLRAYGLVLALATLAWCAPTGLSASGRHTALDGVRGLAGGWSAVGTGARVAPGGAGVADRLILSGVVPAAEGAGVDARGGLVSSLAGASGRLPQASEAVTAPGPAARPALAFLQPHAGVAGAPEVATLEVPAPGGTFSVPYIQSGGDLRFALAVAGAGPDDRLEVALDAGTPGEALADVAVESPSGVFPGIGFGEHTLTARLLRAGEGRPEQVQGGERTVAQAHLTQVARGDIVAAMGDSTTEGVGGGPWSPDQVEALAAFPDWIAARAAATRAGLDWVTADGRNYPQPSNLQYPGRSRPAYTVDLARELEAASGHPALVLNLGFSGGTTDSYVHVVESPVLAREFAVVHPTAYLVDLGVNDALVRRSASDYGQRLTQIVTDLERVDGAQPGQVRLACPIYAKQTARHQAELAYLAVVNQLRASAGLGPAPDFYSYYRDHPDEVADAVHPNAAGYQAMGGLWLHALQGAGAACPG
ncbi:MAG TPA: SGNH/GDSL hydrolase family protein [Candidatus Dormibacteraeota bacterium]|jgi:lysophospholipase L1-like esterase|nr:SGNH/GDSL hydrolase family protein [Candidatus Dormibacteraeota bacterium]